MSRDPRILVLRGGALGDFMLTLPALQALRDRWPGAHIEALAYPHIARLALAGGWLQHIESLDRAGVAQLFSPRPRIEPALRERIAAADIVISWLHDPDGTVGDNIRACGARLYLYQSPVNPRIHATDHLVRPLESLALYEAGRAPVLVAGPEAAEAGGAWLERNGCAARPLAIHPGSGAAGKNWPWDRFLDTARRARADGWQPFFLLGEADAALEEGVMTCGAGPVARGLDLPGVAGLLSRAAAYLGNDSGITHVAAALGLPTTAIFGPTDPAIWAPRGPKVRVLRGSDGRLDAIEPADVWTLENFPPFGYST